MLPLLLLLGVGVAGCRDTYDFGEEARAGMPVLSIVQHDFTIKTRSSESKEQENRIENIYYWIFADGELIRKGGTTPNVSKNTPYGEAAVERLRIANIPVEQWNEVKAYAIANYGPEATSYLGGLKPVELEELKTVEQIEGLMAELPYSENSIYLQRPKHGFLMSGKSVYTSKPANLTIRVDLKRVDAKIKFVISGGEDEKGKYEVKPKRWRVHSIPLKAMLFEGVPHTFSNDRKAFFHYNYEADTEQLTPEQKQEQVNANRSTLGWRGFEENEDDYDSNVDKGYNAFTFYMYENIQQPKKEINAAALKACGAVDDDYWNKIKDSPFSVYRFRERQEKLENTGWKNEAPNSIEDISKYRNGAFVFAPDNGTYVEFEANLYKVEDKKYTDATDPQEKSETLNHYLGPVHFIVHLGDFEGTSTGNALNNDTYLNNYNVLRNNYYIYKVKVNGYSGIQLEVEKNNTPEYGANTYETNPGYEGDITESYGDVRLDAHYDQGVVLLNFFDLKKKYCNDAEAIDGNGLKEHMRKAAEKGNFLPYVRIEAHTPYNVGLGPEVVKTGTDGPKDVHWLKFIENDKSVPSGTYIQRNAMTYNYVVTNNLLSDFISVNDFGPLILKKFTAMINQLQAESGNKQQKLEELLRANGFDPVTGDKTFTVFADEFYYEEHPVKAGISDMSEITYSYRNIKGHGGAITHGAKLGEEDWKYDGWRTFVNQPDRVVRIYLLGKERTYSSDGMSSFGDPDIAVSQRSIYAPYNLSELPQRFCGRGFERVNEMQWSTQERMQSYPQEAYVTNKDGLSIMDGHSRYVDLLRFDWLVGKPWEEIIESPKQDRRRPTKADRGLKFDHFDWYLKRCRDVYNMEVEANFAGYYPMIGNRDINGNGTVDAEEVKWFMPALPEMEYFWMTQNALPPTERLLRDFPYLTSSSTEGRDNVRDLASFHGHYGVTFRQTVASSNLGRNDRYVLDPPGTKSIRYHYGYSPNKSIAHDLTFRREAVRVIMCRKLGKGVTESIPIQRAVNVNERRFSWNGKTDEGHWIIDCSAFPKAALRRFHVDGPLPPHNMESEYAMPFKAFRMAKQSYARMRGSSKLKDDYDFGYSNPTEEEIALGVGGWQTTSFQRMSDENYRHPCRLYYELADKSDKGKWRLPNIKELQLMIRYVPQQYRLDLQTFDHKYTTTYHYEINGWCRSPWMNRDNAKHRDIYDRYGYESLMLGGYQGSIVLSSTQDWNDGTVRRFYAADFYAKLFGFRLAAEKEIEKSYFDVRCVRDLTESEYQAMKTGVQPDGSFELNESTFKDSNLRKYVTDGFRTHQ